MEGSICVDLVLSTADCIMGKYKSSMFGITKIFCHWGKKGHSLKAKYITFQKYNTILTSKIGIDHTINNGSKLAKELLNIEIFTV